ncbi:disintegrin and metalloproteinase domain-containing protein 24-like [Cricetulus griseus]|uniref:Disintegrin and metalloproteinase domain-containing protein 24-like n=2 Tax=Cricetulus griseus TaxID=10029 RepID=A0A9J7F4E3_CRIGR|nr:disintegrin and metalloproteinase domain-containing protein 24-like [Cricetulus griseus]
MAPVGIHLLDTNLVTGAMSESPVHLRKDLLPVWLGLLLFPSIWPLAWCAESKSLPEVVMPLRVTVSSRDRSLEGWKSYSMHFGGQRHIISMKPKNFLVSRHLSVFTYSDQGNLFEDQPFVQNDCHYLGFVEGNPESMVALTTCFGGFQGTIQINDTAYEIKPKSPSSTFEHLIYKTDSEKAQLPSMRCGLTDEEIIGHLRLQEDANSTIKQIVYEEWWTHRLNIEMALVIDHEQFLYRGSNTSLVVQDVFMIMNGLNFYLFPADINVYLLGLVIWNKKNPIPVKDVYTLLPSFCKWKRENLDSYLHHDIAHLFVNYNFSNYFGIAYVGTICNKTFSCGVESFLGENFFTFGQIVAHEIGHNLGMPHDGIFCTCGRGACVMSATTNSSRKFSNCSYAVLWEITGKTSCIHTKPNPLDIYQIKFCGNRVVEEGEECDCGSPMECEYSSCCLPDCTLKFEANCDSGLCCSNLCQILPSGTICRVQESECDLPEWCNGTSHECPEDVFLQDGSSCSDGGYCYKKRCNSHDEQCRRIFGKEARKASDSCYQELNTFGDRFGNCGITGNTYVKCNSSDILCGRVQCKEVKRLPFWRSHYTVHWTRFNDVTCWSTDYHFGMTIPDLGDIKDGTKCGPEHVCINRKCIRKSIWASDCSAETCNKNGVCNNKHHCHCDDGWSPPHCLVNGTGGSIDSGPNSGSKVKGKEKENGEGKEKDKDKEWEEENNRISQEDKLMNWLFPVTFATFLLLLFAWLLGDLKPSPKKEEIKSSSEEEETSTSISTTSTSTTTE